MLTVNKKIDDYCIQTVHFWFQKWPLYQLRHNQCTIMFTASTQNAHLGAIIVKSFINWSQGGTGLGYLDRDYVLMNQDDGSLIYVGFNGISFAKSSFTNPVRVYSRDGDNYKEIAQRSHTYYWSGSGKFYLTDKNGEVLNKTVELKMTNVSNHF